MEMALLQQYESERSLASDEVLAKRFEAFINLAPCGRARNVVGLTWDQFKIMDYRLGYVLFCYSTTF